MIGAATCIEVFDDPGRVENYQGGDIPDLCGTQAPLVGFTRDASVQPLSFRPRPPGADRGARDAQLNPKAVRASTGSLFHLPVVYAEDPIDLLADLAGGGMSCLATTGAAAPVTGGRAVLDLFEAADGGVLDLLTAWIFGSEAHGLPAGVLDAADAAVTVPIFGRAESTTETAAGHDRRRRRPRVVGGRGCSFRGRQQGSRRGRSPLAGQRARRDR